MVVAVVVYPSGWIPQPLDSAADYRGAGWTTSYHTLILLRTCKVEPLALTLWQNIPPKHALRPHVDPILNGLKCGIACICITVAGA